MAKAIFCETCGHLETLDTRGGTTFCRCDTGRVVGWWVDQSIGLAQVAVLPPGERSKAWVVKLHNDFLRAGSDKIPPGYLGPEGQVLPFAPGQLDELWRYAHKRATERPPRPEALSVFDRSRRECPLVIERPGTTPDTHWATEPELTRRGLLEVTRA